MSLFIIVEIVVIDCQNVMIYTGESTYSHALYISFLAYLQKLLRAMAAL